MNNTMFDKAKPIWISGKDKSFNQLYGFVLKFRPVSDCCRVRIAASDSYQCYCNGLFVAAGPARTARGYCRIDELLLQCTAGEENTLVFTVASYNVNCFEYDCSGGYFQSEVFSTEGVLAYTDERTAACSVPWHMQEVLRYSFQRVFTEVWKIDSAYTEFLNGITSDRLPAEEIPERKFLNRNSRIPLFGKCTAQCIGGGLGRMNPIRRDYVTEGPQFLEKRKLFQTFLRKSVGCDLINEIHSVKTVACTDDTSCETIGENEFRLFDFQSDTCGFLSLEISVPEGCTFYLMFDEILSNGDVDALRLNCVNAVRYTCQKGEYALITLEPYAMRYLKLYCRSGKVHLKKIYLREYVNPVQYRVKITGGNEDLKMLFSAALRTFSCNAVDLLTDCPSRERGGWLHDSYFTGRTEYALTGENRVEHDFLENYILAPPFQELPKGMIPMCYPGQHPDGVFIPTWAIWFVLELEEYFKESRDRALIESAKDKVYGILAYFSAFENEFGLLENLQGWVFIEWSDASSYVQGVNYCINMLYAKMKECAGRLYEDGLLLKQAEELRGVIREQSFNGIFFADHSVRENGTLNICPQISEVCQYCAFFVDVATPQTYPQLWSRLCEGFGPNRGDRDRYSNVCGTNMLIGNFLRLMLLRRYGLSEQLQREAVEYFSDMVRRTGTLWEDKDDTKSCNHGFASYLICLLLPYVGIQNKGFSDTFEDETKKTE